MSAIRFARDFRLLFLQNVHILHYFRTIISFRNSCINDTNFLRNEELRQIFLKKISFLSFHIIKIGNIVAFQIASIATADDYLVIVTLV